jgi:hypothetical protein
MSTIFLEISKHHTDFYKIPKSQTGFKRLFGFFDLLRQYPVYFDVTLVGEGPFMLLAYPSLLLNRTGCQTRGQPFLQGQKQY